LARQVARRLRRRWSPEQISKRLRKEHPNDPSWWVSHETIYQSLFVQGRGGLRKELTKALRTGRARRRPRRRKQKYGQLAHMVLLSERPAEVEDRAVPGHWEGDLIIGKDSQSQVGTLVERTSRYVVLVRLPKDRMAYTVRTAIKNHMMHVPKELKHSLTWDRGKEMAEHELFRISTGMQVYFCDPHSPWQRGTGENTNGLVRQYLPKRTDLSKHSAKQLRRIAHELNTRPRKTLDWMTPAEKFAELVATTG
jgi:IS30 family transposase